MDRKSAISKFLPPLGGFAPPGKFPSYATVANRVLLRLAIANKVPLRLAIANRIPLKLAIAN